MKILVLMPLDERYTYLAAAIYKNLPKDVQEHTLCMPAFMDYMVYVKLCPNWEYALFDTILTAEKVYKATDKEDLIILGNVGADCEFDAVFNFQDNDEDLPYEDKFLEKMQKLAEGEHNLEVLVNNVHKAEESKMALHNCKATADFLTNYLKTDPKLDDIKKEYEIKSKMLEEDKNDDGNYQA